MKPGGRYLAKDLFEVGGVSIILKALQEGNLLNLNCMTVTGKTIEENIKDIKFDTTSQKVVYSTSKPIYLNWRCCTLKEILRQMELL